ncbi:MAG: hypothetical protein QM731_07750 [Chitinophagaceae bacterium]
MERIFKSGMQNKKVLFAFVFQTGVILCQAQNSLTTPGARFLTGVVKELHVPSMHKTTPLANANILLQQDGQELSSQVSSIDGLFNFSMFTPKICSLVVAYKDYKPIAEEPLNKPEWTDDGHIANYIIVCSEKTQAAVAAQYRQKREGSIKERYMHDTMELRHLLRNERELTQQLQDSIRRLTTYYDSQLADAVVYAGELSRALFESDSIILLANDYFLQGNYTATEQLLEKDNWILKQIDLTSRALDLRIETVLVLAQIKAERQQIDSAMFYYNYAMVKCTQSKMIATTELYADFLLRHGLYEQVKPVLARKLSFTHAMNFSEKLYTFFQLMKVNTRMGKTNNNDSATYWANQIAALKNVIMTKEQSILNYSILLSAWDQLADQDGLTNRQEIAIRQQLLPLYDRYPWQQLLEEGVWIVNKGEVYYDIALAYEDMGKKKKTYKYYLLAIAHRKQQFLENPSKDNFDYLIESYGDLANGEIQKRKKLAFYYGELERNATDITSDVDRNNINTELKNLIDSVKKDEFIFDFGPFIKNR